jgi:ABC-type lipoprotein export system ATPase subunit
MTTLRLESVSKTYVRGRLLRRALADVSLEVSAGEFIAIHGEPRSGKSTLLRVAAGIETPDAGRVIYGGRDLGSMSDAELADYRLRGVAWVSASRPSLPGYRALDVVALPLLAGKGERGAAESRAHDALRTAGAEDCFDAGLEELSESERQRVSIAQAIVRRPEMIVADEPVAGLGVTESRAILDLLRELAHRHGMGVVVTASEASELLGASRILGLLSGGRLVDPEPEGRPGGDVVEFPRAPRARDA